MICPQNKSGYNNIYWGFLLIGKNNTGRADDKQQDILDVFCLIFLILSQINQLEMAKLDDKSGTSTKKEV